MSAFTGAFALTLLTELETPRISSLKNGNDFLLDYVRIPTMQLAHTYQSDITILWEAIVADLKAEYLSETQRYPWIIGFSGGKDSTLVAQAVLEAILAVPPSARTREVHVISNDTLVESPMVIGHLANVQQQIGDAARNMGLPVTVATTHPDIGQSFWVNIIGRGYPTPNQNFRWCTDRLKIQPTSTYILKNVSIYGAAIVVLGVRKDESNSRRNSIDKFQNIEDIKTESIRAAHFTGRRYDSCM